MELIKYDIALPDLISIIKGNNVTAYEIGQNTELSTVGVGNIINGEVKKPNKNTIKDIVDYLNNKLYNKGKEVKLKSSQKNDQKSFKDINWLKINRMIEKNSSVQSIEVIRDNLITTSEMATSNYEQLGRILSEMAKMKLKIEKLENLSSYGKSGSNN